MPGLFVKLHHQGADTTRRSSRRLRPPPASAAAAASTGWHRGSLRLSSPRPRSPLPLLSRSAPRVVPKAAATAAREDRGRLPADIAGAVTGCVRRFLLATSPRKYRVASASGGATPVPASPSAFVLKREPAMAAQFLHAQDEQRNATPRRACDVGRMKLELGTLVDSPSRSGCGRERAFIQRRSCRQSQGLWWKRDCRHPGSPAAAAATAALGEREGILLQTRRRLPAGLRHLLPQRRVARVTADGRFIHCAADTATDDLEVVDLLRATVRSVPGAASAAFQVVTSDGRRRRFLAADTCDRDAWVAALHSATLDRLRSASPAVATAASASSASSPRPTASAVALLEAAAALPGNEVCADCGAPGPDWASVSLGLLICIRCSGAHRRLGTHLSRVRSIALDAWTPAQALPLCVVGNRLGNAMWEARLPASGCRRPGPDAASPVREAFVRAKYERGEFLAAQPSSPCSA